MAQIEVSYQNMTGERPISQCKQPVAHPELSEWLTLVGKNQDQAAYVMLFDFFAPKIKRFGLKQYRNEWQANELVQDTMTNVWRKAHLYDQSKGAATTWIYTVMRNASFDHLRKIKNKDEQNLGDDIWPLENAQIEKDPEPQAFVDHLLSNQLIRIVDTLPQAQKVVVKGVYYQELSQQQLANQLGVPVGTIKSRLRLALEKIRQQMGEQDHD